jgi:GT2 family glycosyltransferase
MNQPGQSPGTCPALAIILVVAGQRERAARALHSVLGQSAIDQIEVLLFDCAPDHCAPLPGSDHGRVKMERLSPNELLSTSRARGVRGAQAPVVCFMEEHCEMQSGWADAVIRAHCESWAGVGTNFVNANPDAGLSNKAFRMNYGVYVLPMACRGPVPLVAGQNSAFKREVLLRYEPFLELMLNADLVLQWKMQQDGYRMFYEPGATMAHNNENTFRSLSVGVFYWNWCFSNVRAQMFKWSLFRRVAWIAATPLMPWVRLIRICRRSSKHGARAFMQFLADAPFIFGISHFAAAGQLIGLVKPIDKGVRKFSHFEMNEPRFSRIELAQ